MKRKYILIFVCLLTIFLFGCKCNKCSKMTADKIKDEYKYFDITVTINKNKYQIIKSSKGIYYYNFNNDSKIYFDNVSKIYYELEDEKLKKTELNSNYNLDKYISDIYYVLSYHTSKTSLKNYDVESTTYLDKDVNLYVFENDNLKEEMYIAKDINICLGFYLKTSDKEINAKIESIESKDTDLSKYNNYQTIKNDLSTIKEQYKTFNITINLDGNEYQFIKSVDGYFYENKKQDITLYYDINSNTYYTLDKKSKTKTIIDGDYSMDAYIDNIYYVLSYHVDKKLLLDYNKESSTYLGRDVVKYVQENSYVETIIFDIETNACLSFEVKSSTETVSGKITKLSFEETDFTYLNEYQTLKQCTDLELLTKTEITDNFTNYTIVIKQNESTIKAVKTKDGFLCLITKGDDSTGVVYDKENNIWYDINDTIKEKSLSDKEYTIDEYEVSIFTYLTGYLTKLDEKFFMLQSEKYLDRDVTIYIKNVAIKDTLYKQEYVIDNLTGACLKQNITINGSGTYFVIEELSFDGDISSYLEYEEVYYAWPKDHEYLIGVEEIEYGKLVKGFEDEDGLNLYYENINQSFFLQILKDMKASGFVKNAQENGILDAYQNYSFYTYEATNDLGIKIRLEFDGSEKTLLIILSK